MRENVESTVNEIGIDDVILKVSDLSVTEQGRVILEGVDFTLGRGKTLAIVGPNGAGKTTLFRVLMNLIPFSGKVEWSGKVRIGYVPQTLVSTDLPISVEEFLNLKSISDHHACMNSVGLSHDVEKQRLSQLSGGELQRVLLGWAIADNPDVLLFDEPTSLVDIGAEEPIYGKIKSIREEHNITILLISHNLHVVSHYSDFLLALNRRQVFFGGTSTVSHRRLVEMMAGLPAESG